MNRKLYLYKLVADGGGAPCVWRTLLSLAICKPKIRYHAESDQRKKDVGKRFENAYVLLSRDYRYFGIKGKDDCQRDFPVIKKLVEGLKRGHRVNFSVELRGELLVLKKEVWRKYGRMKIGAPTDADQTRLCNSDSASVRC